MPNLTNKLFQDVEKQQHSCIVPVRTNELTNKTGDLGKLQIVLYLWKLILYMSALAKSKNMSTSLTFKELGQKVYNERKQRRSKE